MAINGTGTQADPYIVDNWDDFLTVMSSSSNYVKFANPDREITGNGSISNPFVVSTYEEMLLKTGATYIWQAKLIDRESRLYCYHDVYCIYDDSLTTIDFNLINNGAPISANINVNASVDFNGWTWKNLTLDNAQLRFEGTDIDGTKNLIISNMIYNGYIDGSSAKAIIHRNPSYLRLVYFIIDITIVPSSGSSEGSNIQRFTNADFLASSIIIHCKSNSIKICGGYEACHVHFDIDCYLGLLTETNFSRSLVTGEINSNRDGYYEHLLDGWIGLTIFDLKSNLHTSVYWQRNSAANCICIYNKDTMPMRYDTITNLVGLTTEQLKDPDEIAAVGFPIGVDSLE